MEFVVVTLLTLSALAHTHVLTSAARPRRGVCEYARRLEVEVDVVARARVQSVPVELDADVLRSATEEDQEP